MGDLDLPGQVFSSSSRVGARVARAAGVIRASLYKSLAEGVNPHFTTVSKVAKVLGGKLSVA